MLPKQILCFLTLFDAFGFNSRSTNLSKTQTTIYSIYLVHICLAIIFVVMEIYITFEYYPLLLLTEAISECMQYCVALSTYWLTIFDSCLHQQEHQHFWQLVQDIDLNFCDQRNFKCRNYSIKFAVFLIKTIIIVILRLVVTRYISLIADIAYTFLPIICEIRMFYYLFCLEVIYFQLKMIEKEFIAMKNKLFATDVEHYAKPVPFLTFELQRLRWIRSYFHRIYTMMDLLNEIFGWSHVAVISYCFFYILTEMNWLYLNFRIISYARCTGMWSISFMVFIILKLMVSLQPSRWISHIGCW